MLPSSSHPSINISSRRIDVRDLLSNLFSEGYEPGICSTRSEVRAADSVLSAAELHHLVTSREPNHSNLIPKRKSVSVRTSEAALGASCDSLLINGPLSHPQVCKELEKSSWRSSFSLSGHLSGDNVTRQSGAGSERSNTEMRKMDRLISGVSRRLFPGIVDGAGVGNGVGAGVGNGAESSSGTRDAAKSSLAKGGSCGKISRERIKLWESSIEHLLSDECKLSRVFIATTLNQCYFS
ncbi:unnamed protein product [Protopolystoma xenopodis]|uniref:Uncharacterized protein n=1 Tax=Protopolystoma xenopodis TaxID=117903 RepID=A0A448WDH0_9PLAT|nr:unnamed protein product [Protopolystoma xenopodis]